MCDFCHLHLHTSLSLLDGGIKISDLVKKVKEYGMTSCGVSEHGWLASAVEFYKECKKTGIKPLLGSELYITQNEDGLPNENKVRDNHHMVVIAKDYIGYKKLVELVSEGSLNNFYYKPRVYKEKLRALAGHAIFLSGCLGGQLPKQLEFKKDLYGKAIGVEDIEGKFKKEFEWFSKEFNNDFYLELQVWDNGDHFQPVLNKFLLDYGKETGAQFVLTADAHYLNKEDEKLHEILMAMQQKMTLQEYKENSELQYGPYFYVASGEEMLDRAKSINCEEAFYNTQIIKDKCNVEIPLGKYQEIYYPIDNNLKDYDEFIKWKENNNI